jgi:hypothetical protein
LITFPIDLCLMNLTLQTALKSRHPSGISRLDAIHHIVNYGAYGISAD